MSGMGSLWMHYYAVDTVEQTNVTINAGFSSGNDEELMTLTSKYKYFSSQYYY